VQSRFSNGTQVNIRYIWIGNLPLNSFFLPECNSRIAASPEDLSTLKKKCFELDLSLTDIFNDTTHIEITWRIKRIIHHFTMERFSCALNNIGKRSTKTHMHSQ
jgi:hypothetical protein